MSVLVQSVSRQQLKHEFESFLKRFYRKIACIANTNICSFKYHQRCCAHTTDLEEHICKWVCPLIMHPPLISLTIHQQSVK